MAETEQATTKKWTATAEVPYKDEMVALRFKVQRTGVDWEEPVEICAICYTPLADENKPKGRGERDVFLVEWAPIPDHRVVVCPLCFRARRS